MNTKNARENVKLVANFVVGASVGWTVKNIIANNTNPEDRRQKAEAYVGGAVVGAMAKDAAEAWTDQKVDAAFDAFNRVKEFVKQDPNKD